MAGSKFRFNKSKFVKKEKKVKEKKPKKQKLTPREKKEEKLARRRFVRFVWRDDKFCHVVIFCKLAGRVVYDAKVKDAIDYEIDYTNRRYGATNIIHRHKKYIDNSN